MKWWQAALTGAANKYSEIKAGEREAALEKELLSMQLAEEAKADATKDTLNFGDYAFKDRNYTGMDTWTKKGARIEDMASNIKSNFYDQDGTFLEDKYNQFKQTDKINHDKMVNEWMLRMKQWMYPTDPISGTTTEGTAQRERYNKYDYEWLKPMDAFYQATKSVDIPREVGQVEGVIQTKDGQNITKMFDVVEGVSETTKPENIIVRPDEGTMKDMATAMEPVLLNHMYGGKYFKSKEDYYNKVVGPNATHQHVLVVANSLWNHKNKVKGFESKSQVFEEIAQAQIYYNKSHDDIIEAVNYMIPKFSLTDMGATREITRNKGLTPSELTGASEALAAQERLNRLSDLLLEQYDKTQKTGLTLTISNLWQGLVGQGGQIDQAMNLMSEYQRGIDNGVFDKEKSGTIFKSLQRLKEIEGDRNWVKDKDRTIEYLNITLAYNLALSEQGTGGGRAISDNDFDNAMKRVGGFRISNTGQVRETIKLLKSINANDYMFSRIKTDNKYGTTSRDLVKFWGDYKPKFDAVVNDYASKLQGNYIYGELKNANGEVIDGYYNNEGNFVKYNYNGRLAQLMNFDFGTATDTDKVTPGLQSIWDGLTEPEKIVLHDNPALMNKFKKQIGIDSVESGFKTPNQILDEKNKLAQDEINVAGDVVTGKDYPFNTQEWWDNTKDPIPTINRRRLQLLGDVISVVNSDKKLGLKQKDYDGLMNYANTAIGQQYFGENPLVKDKLNEIMLMMKVIDNKGPLTQG